MQRHRSMSGRVTTATVVALLLAAAGVTITLLHEHGGSQALAQAGARLEATIFSYDGKEFVRTRTTLLTEDGKSAVNTKLDHAGPAYDALIHKHSYSGEATVFGRHYDANYAPLTNKDGKLTGALFVAVAE